ncbi:MAG: 16S rRNA (cytosine(1402)-N(4))-methyltransferase RsmH [Clostridia bacterium]|nr:16S rRNA (cytosine(1402)-N(4))-methyltransferase RsmH [Clostridia bacterium]
MDNIVFSHKPVMFDECMTALNIKPDGVYVDGTAGGGGHSSGIASRLTSGKLIAIDQDAAAIEAAGKRLAPFGDRVTLVRDNFKNIASVCASLGINKIDGVLLDLGVSSYQLDTAERGFSYNADAPLDMRMDKRRELSAYHVVNEYSAQELKRIIYDYGEERFAPKIAAAIVNARQSHKIETTGELAALIKSAMPSSAKEGGHHPAKRTFQAIRIEVNGELDVIEPAIRAAVHLLAPGGRAAVITFHSLEDRITKQTFASLASGCTCPRDFPVCVCGKVPSVKLVGNKPIVASAEELECNPRARSAKLRIAEKL